MNLTEEPLDDEMEQSLKKAAQEGAVLIGLDPQVTDASIIVERIDDFVSKLQQGSIGQANPTLDFALPLGSLWGEQLVRALGWQWAAVTFHDLEDTKAVGVFSPDRALAIYPLHFVYSCQESLAPVTIFLAYNILVDGSRVPPLPERCYENVMDNVHPSKAG